MAKTTGFYSTLVIIILIYIFGFGVIAWHLSQAPDVFSDEILYTRVGTRIASEGALVWDGGDPVYIHPPLYFLTEGAYLWLTSNPAAQAYTPGNIFAAVYHARYLNAVFAGITAVLLFLIGRRLRGVYLGLLLAALFILDPFGVRTNRRAMLETMAALLSLAGMALLLVEKSDHKANLSQAIGAGLLFGLGLLTKELTFTVLLALLVFGVWEILRSQRAATQRYTSRFLSTPFVAILVALLTYSLYPAWMWATGNWAGFWAVKWLAIERLIGIVHLNGWNRPGLSLWTFLLPRLIEYGSTYLLLLVGGTVTLLLLLLHHHDRTGRLLGVWGLVLYPFYTFVALFGTGNDQFFYYLLVPAIILVGYATLTPTAWDGRHLPLSLVRHPLLRGMPVTLGPWLRQARIAALIWLLSFVLPFNLVRWWINYGVGADNGYDQLARYVQDYMPGVDRLYTSGDNIKPKYFFPAQIVVAGNTLEAIQAAGVHYFVVAPKDIWAHYGQMTSAVAGWITANGKLLFHTYDDSYGDIYFYQVAYPDPAQVATPASALRGPLIRPAQSGFVASFMLALGVWCGLAAGIMFGLRWRRSAWRLRPGSLSENPIGQVANLSHKASTRG